MSGQTVFFSYCFIQLCFFGYGLFHHLQLMFVSNKVLPVIEKKCPELLGPTDPMARFLDCLMDFPASTSLLRRMLRAVHEHPELFEAGLPEKLVTAHENWKQALQTMFTGWICTAGLMALAIYLGLLK